MAQREVPFGVLPYFKGAFQGGQPYSLYNQVTYGDSTYQSLKDNNTTVPADEKGEPTKDWICVARGNANLLLAMLETQVALNGELVKEVEALRLVVDNGGHHKALSYDAEDGFKVCGHPVILKGHGTPSAENIPDQKGIPAFFGQKYIDMDAPSNGEYYAIGTNSVSDWRK